MGNRKTEEKPGQIFICGAINPERHMVFFVFWTSQSINKFRRHRTFVGLSFYADSRSVACVACSRILVNALPNMGQLRGLFERCDLVVEPLNTILNQL